MYSISNIVFSISLSFFIFIPLEWAHATSEGNSYRVLDFNTCKNSIKKGIFAALKVLTTVLLIFTGDIKITGTCVGTYDNGKSEITTPNYPSSYPDSKQCNWNIEVPQGHLIELKFNDFNLEFHSTCDYDYLQVYDGRSSSSRTINGKLCGSSKPSKILSSGNALFLNWKSDSSQFFKGFEISATLTGKHILKHFK